MYSFFSLFRTKKWTTVSQAITAFLLKFVMKTTNWQIDTENVQQ